MDAEGVVPSLALTRREAQQTIAKASESPTFGKGTYRELAKLTTKAGGQGRFLDHPPLISRITEGESPETLAGMEVLLDQYFASLEPQRRVLLERYRLVDAVRQVVGVAGVGRRNAVALLQGDSTRNMLMLQVREASVAGLEVLGKPSLFESQGERVVRGQRLCQAESDPFLGWAREADGRDYYIH